MVDLLIAMLIFGVVSGAILDLLPPATAAFDTQLEVSDLQQRVRVAVSTLQRDLAAAAAGAYGGGTLGVLGDHVAPVLPYRWGDPPGTFRTDTITVLFVPDAAAETAVVKRMPPVGAEQVIETRGDCGGARHDARCGFAPGMRVLLYRPRARWDIGVATQVHDAALHLVGVPALPPEYDAADAVAAQLDAHTYYLKTDVANDRFELMHYDGDQTDLPVVDHVVKLAFRYWGDPRPPRLIAGRALSDPGPWTTYGPPPPDIGSPSGMGWPDGENCVFTTAAGAHIPRLADLVPEAGGLAQLTAALLNDGPWCPDAVTAFRYDADLLRVRRIDITLRVEAGPAWLRGPASVFFTRAGTAQTSRYVPDQEVTFTVAPRNLGTER
jgi:hypothetical protein